MIGSCAVGKTLGKRHYVKLTGTVVSSFHITD